MIWIPFLPLMIPFVAGVLLAIHRRNKSWQKTVSICAVFAMLIASGVLLSQVMKGGIVVVHMGNWPPPFGIMLAIDTLGAIMTMLTSVVAIPAVLYALHDTEPSRMNGSFFSLFYFLLFGINGTFMTGDLFNLFVFFEIVLMSSYVLMVLGNENKQVKFGFTYLTINFIGSTLFLVAAGIIFGQLGTLNMAHLAARMGEIENTKLVTMVAILFLCVFGLKSAMFPIFNWLPDAYSAPPTAVSALFAGLLTKVGVYSLFRVFGTIFAHDVGFIHHGVLAPLAALTMLVGVWGAMVQYDIRYILAFHSISQVGYMLMGLAIFSPLALAGGVFHMIHHSVVKSSLFLIGGGIGSRWGTQDLKKLGGLANHATLFAVLFIVSAMALSGAPPLSGFFSKLALIMSAFSGGHPWLVGAALMTSLFTLYSMIKIWRLGFWGTTPDNLKAGDSPGNRGLAVSCAISVLIVLTLTFLANPIMTLSKTAGDQLLNREAYIEAVMTSRPAPQRGRP